MLRAYLNTEKSAIELYRILRKPYLRNKDLCELMGCSKTTASKVFDEIHSQAIARGESPIVGAVPKEAFLKWQGLTEEDYVRYARVEKELG